MKKIFLSIPILLLMLSVLQFQSCTKEELAKTNAYNDAPLEIRDSTSLTRAQTWSYYVNNAAVTEASYMTTIGSSFTPNYIMVNVEDDSINNVDLIDVRMFTTKAAYLTYTDGTLGLDEAAQFVRVDSANAYLASQGITTPSEATTLTLAQRNQLDAILNPSSISVGLGLFPLSRFFDLPNFTTLIFTWTAGKIPYFLDANNRISSYRTEKMIFKTVDRFYDIGSYVTNIGTFKISKKSKGNSIFEVPDFSKVNNKLDNAASSWTKSLK